MSNLIDAHADGENVVIRVGANEADTIAWALWLYSRGGHFDARRMKDAINDAVDEAIANGALMRPGLTFTVSEQ